MSNFIQDEFNQFVLGAGVIGFFKDPIIFKSGRVSNNYVNWRNATEDVYTIDQISDFIISFAKFKGIDFDCIYGVPEGGTKLGVISQYKWSISQDNFAKGSHRLAMGRAKPKQHGALKDKNFVGIPTGRVLVVEDTITTGGSLIETLNTLKSSGVNIVGVIGLIDRDERRDDGKTPGEVIKAMGYDYYAMSHCKDLLPIAFKEQGLEEGIGVMTEKYYERYGVSKIKLL